MNILRMLKRKSDERPVIMDSEQKAEIRDMQRIIYDTCFSESGIDPEFNLSEAIDNYVKLQKIRNEADRIVLENSPKPKDRFDKGMSIADMSLNSVDKAAKLVVFVAVIAAGFEFEKTGSLTSFTGRSLFKLPMNLIKF